MDQKVGGSNPSERAQLLASSALVRGVVEATSFAMRFHCECKDFVGEGSL
jgi:hypothetical protein